jgi:serine protease Do
MNCSNRIKRIYLPLLLVVSLACGFLLGRRDSVAGRIDSPCKMNQALAAEKVAGISQAKAFSRSFIAVARTVRPAVVHISVERKVTRKQYNDPDEFFRRFFGPEFMPRRKSAPREQVRRGQGSGVIIDKQGHILTNNHVVGKADLIKVKLSDRREFVAKLVGADERSDVAVIKIDAQALAVAATGDSDALSVGEWVLAIGNPFGLEQTVTSGVISAKSRTHVADIQYQDFLQTDAAINPGNSGGPLVDLDGKVIGINTAIFSRSGGYMGIGFAIPINMARKIMTSLIAHGKVVRGWLGVRLQDINDDMAKVLNLPKAGGAMVVEVVEKSPAATAGLKERDVIVSCDGREVKTPNDLMNAVGFLEVGSKARLEVFRNGKKVVVNFKVAERTAAAEASETGGERLEKLGLTVEEINDKLRETYEIDKRVKGVVITEVKAGSPASRSGLKPGVVIETVEEKKVRTVADLKRGLGVDKERVLIKIFWRGRRIYMAFRLK